MKTSTRLTDSAAITHAEDHDLELCSYSDAREEGREGLSTAEARSIVSEGGEVYLDVETEDHETTGPFPYFAPVAHGEAENPAAHGGVCYVDTRDDGRKRTRNVNGSHEESSGWLAQD